MHVAVRKWMIDFFIVFVRWTFEKSSIKPSHKCGWKKLNNYWKLKRRNTSYSYLWKSRVAMPNKAKQLCSFDFRSYWKKVFKHKKLKVMTGNPAKRNKLETKKSLDLLFPERSRWVWRKRERTSRLIGKRRRKRERDLIGSICIKLYRHADVS